MAVRNIEMFNEPRKAVIVARKTISFVKQRSIVFARVPRNDADRSRGPRFPDNRISSRKKFLWRQ